MDTKRLREIIIELYKLTKELENMFPGRHFTPDGHLVGSIGEALAAFHYGVDLLAASSRAADATWKDHSGKDHSVEIKATQGDRVALRHLPEHLLVIKLKPDGSWAEIYNGPGDQVWRLFDGRNLPSNGQHSVGLSSLGTLMKDVPPDKQIPLVHKVITLQPSVEQK